MKALDKKLILTLSIAFGFIGSVMRIIAYANTAYSTPEWVYNVDSIGYALESTAPFMLIVSLSRYYPRNRNLSFLRIPFSIYSFVSFFDMCKELAGVNGSHTYQQVTVFVTGLITTLIVQYAIYRNNSNSN